MASHRTRGHKIIMIKRKAKKIFICCMMLLSVCIFYRSLIPRDTIALCNYLFKEMYVDLWTGELDFTKVGSKENATITTSSTFRYAVFANCDIDRLYLVNDSLGNRFKGTIKYTVYSDKQAIDAKTVKSSIGWLGCYGRQDDNCRSEDMFQFWMPYNGEYDTITIEMEVLEADSTYLDKRTNVYMSVGGEWLP